MKVAGNAFSFISVMLLVSGCQPGAQNEISHAEHETYRKEIMSQFDFEQEPLKSDVRLLDESRFEKFKVTDTDLLLALGRDKHYYKFFYYSKLDTTAGRAMMTMLGYYDIYFDLLLVSFDGNEVVDQVVIASFAGDEEDFDNIKSQVSGSGELKLAHVTGKRFFENDSISIHSRVDSKVVITAEGLFEATVTSEN